MSHDLQKRAMATRDARLALLDLRRLVDDIACITDDAERAAVGTAIDPHHREDAAADLRAATERLEGPDFTAKLADVRAKLKAASGF
jgi:hypothetical protein